MNDEVKIRLPDVLAPAHHLVFSVYHVHVKKQSSILSSLKHVSVCVCMIVYVQKKQSSILTSLKHVSVCVIVSLSLSPSSSLSIMYLP